jgi:hypothetical protein
MDSRQALIVAVPRCELSEHFADLTQTVVRDVELMTEALHSSGYSVESLGAAQDEPALRSRIRSAISRVCATAPEGGTVLIHFTGHGLSADGADHLVPADAQLTWATTPPQVALDSLIGLDLAELLRGCRAGTVLLTVDACRDNSTADGTDGTSNGGAATIFPARRDRVAVLFGCGPGETCGSDEKRGSHFTRALADALHADTAPRTVADVIAHTVRRTAEFARAHRQVQTPTAHYAPSGPDAIHPVPLCAGRTLHEEWATAVGSAELWAAVEGLTETRRTELHRALVRLTAECARWRSSALAGVPDPWADDDYPVRVLDRGLKALLAPSQTQGGPLVDAGEFAVLAAAPFVREAVYAMGIKETAAVDPFHLDPDTGALGREPERADLEHTFAAHALLWRKGRELAGRGRDEDARAVAGWLLHRHVTGKEQLWDTYAPQLLAPLAKVLIGPDAAQARHDELTDELVRVCRHIAIAPAEPYQGELLNADAQWRLNELFRTDGVTERWRPRELTWLLGVAGLLGGDLRQLPGVLVDNIGVTDGLRPAEAVAGVRELRWARDRLSRTLDLDLPCPHPAVHAAMEILTGWTDEAVQNVRLRFAPAEPTALLAQLPERITCHRLRPRYDSATRADAYAVPLMRFGLAEDEMRELLMGTQLYGDPALALRELYQNALDACRYRQARLRYGEADGRIPYHWDGDIVFRQGTDDEGRPYIECEDNGVGMDRRALRGTFSRAGRRFEQSREYRREQARWRRADPDLRIYPNSRFGIGVFSYFMLADEISIWTRATDEYGRADPGGGLRVDVASTGSLFRIRRSEEAQPTGGTRVRLYLQQDGVDVAKELGTRVWRSDFAMRVERGGDVLRTWEKGALYYFGDAASPVPAGADAWWVKGNGCLLADGILTDPGAVDASRDASALSWFSSDARSGHTDKEATDWHEGVGRPFGFVVDLRAAHTPELSADRARMLSYDRGWVDEKIRHASNRFDAPHWLTLEWLWAFAGVHPDAAMPLVDRLLATDARLTSRTAWDRSVLLDFRQVGCFPVDPSLVRRAEYDTPLIRTGTTNSAFIAWRAAVLRGVEIELARRGRDELALPETTDGYPHPEAWEVHFTTDYFDWSRHSLKAALPRNRDENISLGRLMRRLRRYAIMGLEVPAVTGLEAAHRLLLDETDTRILYGSGPFARGLVGGDSVEGVIQVLSRFSLGQGLPIREALARARRFEAAGFPVKVPETAEAAPADEVATREDLAVLRWHPRFFAPDSHVVGQPPAQELYDDVLNRYAWLGWPHVGPVAAEPPEPVEPVPETRDLPKSWTKEQVDEFTESFGISEYTSHQRLTRRQLGRASGMLGLPVAEVVERFADVLATRALDLPDLAGMTGTVFTRLDSDLLGAVFRGDPERLLRLSWRDDGVHLLDTAQAAVRVAADDAAVAERLTVLANEGLVDGRAPALVEQWRAVAPSDWELLLCRDKHYSSLRHLDRTPGTGYSIEHAIQTTALHNGLDIFFALLAAAKARTALRPAVERLVPLGPLVGLDVSALEGVSRSLPPDLRPTLADLVVCCEAEKDVVRWRSRPTVALLVAHARENDSTLGDSLASLTRYASLGAPWREPEAGPEDWREHRPTEYDSALFGKDLIGDGPVGPLDLVRAAARFGWSLTRTWDRLALYRPLGLDLLMERPQPGADVVPCWQDLILLSRQYTGRAPALSGAVTSERVAVTARELGETTRWVYDRLALYAPLFALTLPADVPAHPAPTPSAELYVAEDAS